MKSKILKVGITGNIGSGKSVVSDYIQNLGYTVIRSDLIAKELLTNDPKIKKQIENCFGDDVYRNGILNTKYLADKIFTTKKNVKLINSIVHPATIKRINELIKGGEHKSNLVFVESALIFEAEIESMFDKIILVFTEKKERIERVKKRENVSEDEIIKRMKFQIGDEKKKNKVDFILYNNSSFDQLQRNVAFLINILESISQNSN